MGVQTHVMEYSGDHVATIDGNAGPLEFLGPLRQFGVNGNWCLVLHALPPGKDYPDIAGTSALEYLQAAGSAKAMTVEIRKPGGQQWGVDWVRYIVGHPHDGTPPHDVPITLPNTTEMRSQPEVFEAEEAAELFIAYYKTGDIPPGYALRPVEGYTTDGQYIGLGGKPR